MPYLLSLFDINKILTFIFSDLKNRTDTSSIRGTMKTQGPCEPVWPSGKALGWQVESSIPLRLSLLFISSKRLWFVDTVL